MKVLITGANGFVGGHLVSRLEAENHQVIKVTRSSHGDLSEINDWESILINEGIECVVHLAAKVHQLNGTLSLEDYERINIETTKHLALAASKTNVKTFVFLSSVKVNGEENASTYTESSTPNPRDPYGESKYKAEEAISLIAKTSSTRFITLRPPLIYGPKVKANMQSLVKIVGKGLPLPFGSIKNKRSFLYVDNLIDAIVMTLKSTGESKKENEIYLISDNDDCSVPNLIADISNALSVKNPLIPFPPKVLDLFFKAIGKAEQFRRIGYSLTVSPNKFMNSFDWKPPYSRKEGLLRSFGER
jgi:nucleoside-diphosphate-sugar epimerase